MENIIVAVVSRDMEFNRALSAGLANATKEIAVKIYNNREFVRLWSNYDGPGAFYDNFDLVLWAGDEVSESYSDNIVYLADSQSLEKMDFKSNRFCIYRFESVKKLAAAVFEIYSHLTGRRAICSDTSGTKLLGFASCCGGSGCTTVAMAVGQELSRFHKKRVLYLSLEDVESTAGFAAAEGGTRTMGEYLYRLLGNDCFASDIHTGGMPFLDSFLIKNTFGIEAFAPTKGRNPLRELTGEDMKRLLVSLKNCERYDAIVADMSSCLSESGMEVMKMSDRICFVSGPSVNSVREENYFRQIKCCCGDRVIAEMIRAENMFERGNDTPSSDSVQKTTIRRIKGKGNNGEDAPLEGGFGFDISQLTDMMIKG